MRKLKYLGKLNEVRKIGQNIENENFKRVFENQVNPILEKYRKRIVADFEMKNQIKEAIEKIGHAAKSAQYIPNCPPNRKNYKDPDFSEHNKLLAVEKKCEELLTDFYDIRKEVI